MIMVTIATPSAKAERGATVPDAAVARREQAQNFPPGRLRLPPFGKELMSLRERGLVPEPHPWFGHIVVCLDDWKVAARFTRVIVPADADPVTLNFTFVAGLDIILAYAPSRTLVARRDATIRQLLRFLPVSLRVIDLDVPGAGFFVKSRARGVEMPEYLP